MGQRAVELGAVNFGDKKEFAEQPGAGEAGSNQANQQNLFWPSTLTASGSAAHCLTETYSTSLERSKPYLMTKSLYQSLAALLGCFIFVQNILISIGLINAAQPGVGRVQVLGSKKFQP